MGVLEQFCMAVAAILREGSSSTTEDIAYINALVKYFFRLLEYNRNTVALGLVIIALAR